MPLAQLFDYDVLFWGVVVIQVIGLLSVWMARLAVGRRSRRTCQRLFLSCLALVGATSVVAMGISAASWLFSAAVLALMVVGAVWDLGGPSNAEPT